MYQRIRVFWDMTLCHWVVLTDVSKEPNICILNTWWGTRRVFLIFLPNVRQTLVHRHWVPSQKTSQFQRNRCRNVDSRKQTTPYVLSLYTSAVGFLCIFLQILLLRRLYQFFWTHSSLLMNYLEVTRHIKPSALLTLSSKSIHRSFIYRARAIQWARHFWYKSPGGCV